MYRRYKKYRPYRRKRRYYYHYDQPSIIEDFLEVVFTIIAKLGRLIGKLIFRWIKSSSFRKKPKTLEIETNKSPYLPNTETQSQIRPQAQEDAEVKPLTQTSRDQRYSLKSSLLTPAENEFLSILEQIIGDRFHIECQVQMSRFINVNDSNAHFTNYHDFNKIKAKSIDFVLSNKEYKPCLAIELDDSTHSRLDRIQRDMFVDDVMEQIHLPILHVRVAYPRPYNADELKKQIFQLTEPDRAGSV